MPDKSINYVMSGAAHTPYLLVSLYKLLASDAGAWGGQGVTRVYCWPESADIVQRIAQDLPIEVVQREPAYRGKNAQFLDKMKALASAPERYAAYLDADTMPVKPIQHLFNPLAYANFVATQFNKWKSNEGIIKKRVSRLIGRDSIPQVPVERALSLPFPSPNGGVWARRDDTKILELWYERTMSVRDLFIADEIVLHALVAEYINGDISVVGNGHYNSSPKFFGVPERDVYLWHFHGDSNVRPHKSSKGHDLWWPVFQECVRKNIGGVAEWKDACGNKYLERCEAQYAQGE